MQTNSSKLTNVQIDTIKNHLTTQREKNSRTHVTSEMITGDTTAPVESMVSVPNSLGDSKVIGPDNSPKANDYDDPMPSSMEKGTNEVQTDYDSDSSHDNDSDEDVSFSDNDKINDIDTMVSDDDEDAGYYYDLKTGNITYKKSISIY